MSSATSAPEQDSWLLRLATKPPVMGLIFVVVLIVLVACVYCVFRVCWTARLWRATPAGRAVVAYQVLNSLTSRTSARSSEPVPEAQPIYMPD
ncbi:ORF28 [Retroperitoneal fibromatosis-associated herpesvirus]|uniref:ORF28 n=1 Tax=Retroperitoneal fibromatosis-associated herpesvirus TaxID=111469 RepID=U5NIV5_9GAMA|nr:ORF28 [Retroperitoneal fibromatosis-associated herpesvirus]AGY30711.1 ORF28 [Retroperitoneal fibromatosis-associated herpesvirus]